jgi:Fe(3+) dicitrate transport protein
VVVIGSPERLRLIAGSGTVLDAEAIAAGRPFTINELFRQVPGVYPRDEEGFGLRPNIGVRGLSPTRSSKVLLLEDGLPLAFAPYGDNASYYHPAFERFDRIEVLKGAGQVQFGPQTVGGVINYITPRAPETFGGRLNLRGGNRGYREVHGAIGDTLDGGTGWIATGTYKASEGSRENMDLEVVDLSAKLEQPLGETQDIALRASFYDERSQVPYSGLTLTEWQANPRGNPFVDDEFDLYRYALSASHAWRAGDAALTTSAYYTYFNRDWWRQSSNSGQRPNDASDPACGGMANLSTTCGNEGRLRQYWTAGVEPRLTLALPAIGEAAEAVFGARFHVEEQYRVQVNGDTPRARTPGTGVNGGIREDNTRDVEAMSAFAQARFPIGRFAVAPGVRYEHVRYRRENALNGAVGRETLEQFIPGIGLTWAAADDVTLFAGAHRGFAPPRTEDIISATGGSVDLDAELSWNYELGVRADLPGAQQLELTAFRLDFENQIVPASLAGGIGSTLTSAGETLHQGAELAWRIDRERVYARLAWTWLGDAEYRSTRFSAVPGFTNVSVTGNRLPYAPEQLGHATLGVNFPFSLRAQVEGTYTSPQFTDDLNSIPISANGQRGRIGGYTVWNVTAEYTPVDAWSFYVSGKNLTDKLYIADMTRGLVPGVPRLVQVGAEYRF